MTDAVHQHTPMYMITGFLGSGKTSVLGSLLSHFRGRRVGLIINEFGQVSIDGTLLQAEEGGGIVTRELNGGQIFCSCLSGSFVDTVSEFKDLGLDALFIETSGLAKPSALLEVISLAERRSEGKCTYGGMLCVIDAQRHLVLSQTLMTLEEQIVYSDRFIVNKADLADSDTLNQIVTSIHVLRPGAWILTATYGKVPLEVLSFTPDTNRLAQVSSQRYAGWQSPGRPKAFVLVPKGPASRRSIEKFLREASQSCYRMKGYLDTTEGMLLYVSASGSQLEISEVSAHPHGLQLGLVCIQDAQKPGDRVFPSRWRLLTGVAVSVRT